MIILLINLSLIVSGFLVYLGQIKIESPYFALGLFYYIFIYLPGYYLMKLFSGDNEYDAIEILPLSLCAGYLFILPLTITAYICNMAFSTFLNIYFPLVFLFVAASHLYFRGERKIAFKGLNAGSPVYLALFAIVLAAALLADHFGGFISGNFLVHVSAIRKLCDFGVFAQNSCYFKDFKYNLNIYSTYYGFLALVSYITRIDPISVWVYLPQFILPVGLLANFAFARKLFKNDKYALLYVFVYFFYYCVYNAGGPAEGQAWFHSEISACNNYISLGIFLPVIMMTALKYAENADKKLLFLMPALFLADGFIHLYVQSKTYYMLFSLLFVSLIIKPGFLERRRLFKICLWGSVGLIVFAYSYYVVSPTLNPAYLTFNGTGGGLNVIFNAGRPLYTDLSNSILRDPLTVGGTLLFFLTVFFIKSDLPALYIFSVFFTVFFVLFNPIMLGIGYKIHPALERVTRLYTIVPFCMALVFPLYIAGKYKQLSRFKPAFWIAIIAVLVLLAKDAPKRLGGIVYTKAYSLELLDQRKGFDQAIRSSIPSGSTVMVNLPFTTWWTTYYSHFIVAHAFSFVLPPNIDQTQRQEDVKHYYQDPLNAGSADILKKYGVDYVFFLNREITGRNMNTAAYLKLVTQNQMFAIYKVYL
jgi:hypothetical protein